MRRSNAQLMAEMNPLSFAPDQTPRVAPNSDPVHRRVGIGSGGTRQASASALARNITDPLLRQARSRGNTTSSPLDDISGIRDALLRYI